MILQYKKQLRLVNDRYIGTVELAKRREVDAVRIHFNNQFYHSFAILYSLVQNVTFKLLTRPENSLTFVNHPFPYNPSEKV